MFGLLVFIEIVVSILLIIVVLLQNSKGSGLAGSLGGNAVGTMFGVRRTSDFLTKATWGLATAFILICLVVNIFFIGGSASKGESIIQKGNTTVPQAAPPRSTPAAQPSGK